MYPNSIYFGPKVPISGLLWGPKYILFGHMDPNYKGNESKHHRCLRKLSDQHGFDVLS